VKIRYLKEIQEHYILPTKELSQLLSEQCSNNASVRILL